MAQEGRFPFVFLEAHGAPHAILTVLLIGGIPVVLYFTKRKLGMVRWLNYNHSQLDKAVPLGALKYALLAAVVVVAIFALWRFWKNRGQLGVFGAASAAATVVVVIAYALVTALVTYDLTPAAFLIVGMMALAALLQCASTFTAARSRGNYAA